MACVIDASLTVAWAFDDEATPYTEHVLEQLRHDSALVPPIWTVEVANALVVGQRRGRLTHAQAAAFATFLLSLRITVDQPRVESDLGPLVALASAQALSAYDAAYLDLAMRERLPLATLDVRLRQAAANLGVRLIQQE